MNDEKKTSAEEIQPEPAKERRKRGKILIDKPMQFSYLSLLLATWLVMLLSVIASNVIFVFVFKRVLLQQHRIDLQVAREMEIFALMNVLIALIPLIAVGLYALIHSHRVAGPLYRLKQSLERICNGDYDFRVQFRRNDFMRDVADMMDSLVVQLREKNTSLKEIQERIERMRGALPNDGSCAQIIVELSEVSEKLKSLAPGNRSDSSFPDMNRRDAEAQRMNPNE